jgi:NAD(P)-dependent dehydrogenase (short-subunit alcohol dehydrogenase family)
VNVVAPGSVVGTRIGDAPTPAELSRLLAATPLRRLGQPADIAEVVCFLCSPAARHVTGTTVVVDGGESLGC